MKYIKVSGQVRVVFSVTSIKEKERKLKDIKNLKDIKEIDYVIFEMMKDKNNKSIERANSIMKKHIYILVFLFMVLQINIL